MYILSYRTSSKLISPQCGLITWQLRGVSTCSLSRNPWLSSCYSVCNSNNTWQKPSALELYKITVLHPPPWYQRRCGIINNTEIIKKKCKSISKCLMSHSSLNALCSAIHTQQTSAWFIHTIFPRLFLLTTQAPTKHRTKMDTPTPSSTCCTISNIWTREMISFLNMSAVSSSNIAVWLHRWSQRRRDRLIIMHPNLAKVMAITELHFLFFFILPHSAKQEGIWYNPWLSLTPCR